MGFGFLLSMLFETTQKVLYDHRGRALTCGLKLHLDQPQLKVSTHTVFVLFRRPLSSILKAKDFHQMVVKFAHAEGNMERCLGIMSWFSESMAFNQCAMNPNIEPRINKTPFVNLNKKWLAVKNIFLLEKSKLAKCPQYIYVYSWPCVKPRCFSGCPELIYENLNNLIRASFTRIFRFRLWQRNSWKFWEVHAGGILPQAYEFLSNVSVKKSFKINLFFQTKLSMSLNATFFPLATTNILTW